MDISKEFEDIQKGVNPSDILTQLLIEKEEFDKKIYMIRIIRLTSGIK